MYDSEFSSQQFGVVSINQEVQFMLCKVVYFILCVFGVLLVLQ